MTNIIITFEKLDGVTLDETRKGNIKPGYEHVNVHMMFDIKMDGKFTKKARLLTDGHTTAPPSSITYSSVVSRESLTIAFILALLNDLDMFAFDIGNAYVNDKFREKIWIEAGTEFGTENIMLMIIERALYGLNSSGAACRARLSEPLMLLGYKSSGEYANVWMKQDFNPNRIRYYKYMLCYVDDLFHICFNPKEDMDALNIIYRLKEVFVPPDRYLGENVEKLQLKGGRVVLSTKCVDYLKSTIENNQHIWWIIRLVHPSTVASQHFHLGIGQVVQRPPLTDK